MKMSRLVRPGHYHGIVYLGVVTKHEDWASILEDGEAGIASQTGVAYLRSEFTTRTRRADPDSVRGSRMQERSR